MPPRRCDMIAKQLDETKQETTPRRNRMVIRDWHLGQLVVFWVGGLLLAGLFYSIIENGPNSPNLLGVILILISGIGLLVVPAVLLIVTWKWFGGRNSP